MWSNWYSNQICRYIQIPRGHTGWVSLHIFKNTRNPEICQDLINIDGSFLEMLDFESTLDAINSDLYRLWVVSLNGRKQGVFIQLKAEK